MKHQTKVRGRSFNKKWKNSVVKLENIYVVTASIVSSYIAERGAGPRCVNWYFLAKCEGLEYYELFSGTWLKKESDTHNNGCVCRNFDTPYIVKVESLKKYLKDCNKTEMDVQLLFDFITNMNVLSSLGAFSSEVMDEEEK